MNYNNSSRERIADINRGMVVRTGVLAATTYMVQTQKEMFNVYGAIWIRQLYVEIISALGADATQLVFNCTFTTPTIAVNAMCAVCNSLANAAQGLRVVWLGGAVATNAVITDSAGLSDVLAATGQIVGLKDGVGTVGILTSAASATQGTFEVTMAYVPMSRNAYVTAAV